MDSVHFEQKGLGTIGIKSTPPQAFKDIAVTANHSDTILRYPMVLSLLGSLCTYVRNKVDLVHFEQKALGTLGTKSTPPQAFKDMPTTPIPFYATQWY